MDAISDRGSVKSRVANASMVFRNFLKGSPKRTFLSVRSNSQRSVRIVDESPSPDPGLACELDRLREQDTSQRMKIQKLTENLNDFKEEIENLRARNEVLEKKGSNVDDEIGVFQERINRLEAEKSRVEQELKEVSASLNKKSSELHEIREQNSELRTQMTRTKRELSEIAEDQGRTASESELSLLKKSKRDLEQKVSELEDELDEMVNKNDLLEQNVTRLNLNMDRMRSDNARETETREEELSELRAQHQRRVRTYEEQLADLTEANNNLQRQMKLLEQRSRQFETQSQYSYETVGSNNYKREFKKTAALLKDTQNLLAMERQKSDKAPLIRKLRLQLEEAEEAKMSAVRSKYSLENELAELNSEIENLRQAKKSLEDRVRDLLSDKAAAVSTSKDLEEQLNSVLRDYRNAVLQTENDSRLISQKAQMIAELEANKQDLTQQLAEAQSQVAYLKTHYVEAHKVTVLERSLVDLKSRIEFERAEKVKFEASSNRLQDEVDRLEDQLGELQRTLIKQQDMAVKHKRELSNEAEANRELRKREEEVASKYKKARDEIDQIQSEHAQTTSDLALALRRIDALQAALNANSDVDDDDERDDLTDDETEADVQSDALELNDSDVKKSEESSENGKVEHTQPITA
uniref:Myosin_tail_1 domain-containing protein n=1 Tax=Bursaphelenchus xylophilus TaxID=6326 RepID=A0A1I7S252_BURXY